MVIMSCLRRIALSPGRAAVALIALAALDGASVAAYGQPPARGTSASDTGPETARRAFRPEDTYRVVTVSNPAMSPDGQRVAVVATRVLEQQNRRRSEVWLAATDGGAPTRVAFGDSLDVTAPRFSPNGQLYVNAGTRAGGTRTYAVPLGGVAPVPVPAAPPANASWSRDGKLAVWADSVRPTTDTARGERPRPDSTPANARAENGSARGPASRPPYGATTQPLDAQRFDGRQFVAIPYKSNDRGFVPNASGPERARPTQLYAWSPGDTVRRALTATAYSHRDAALSPDGRFVAFVADSALRSDSLVRAERDSLATIPYDRARDDVDRDEVDVYVVPVDGSAPPRKLAALPGNESQLAWSPDAASIAFVWQPGRTKSARLATVDVASGRVRDLLGTFAYEPEQFAWASDRLLLVSAQVGGRTALFRVGSGGGGVREVLGGRRRTAGLALDSARHAVTFVATASTTPTELYVANTDGTGVRRLTSFNDALRRDVAFSDAERFTYASVGGRQIEGWVMRPFGYDSTRRYPLVLYIHGGPHSNYGENWFDEFQNLAGAGMMVLFTNPRGSTGYGGEFTYATRGRWGAEDYQDLMTAVDVAARRPDVDSTRMGVTGGSYGGFMTAWITTKTARFKAAEVDRMISDWTYWYGASDAQGLTEFEFYGKPWDNQAMYDSLSPVRHVVRVRTPTLLVQSEEDFRTPMGNAEMWFEALRKRGVPAEFVRYPRSTHELSRSGEPWLLADRLGRIRQWFAHWLLADAPARTTAGAP
ncbi:peptidase S9 [Gemmatimonadetes bacterium T265]|nr:peptidase S9 [Gemmatimonadetes bacterium T265]